MDRKKDIIYIDVAELEYDIKYLDWKTPQEIFLGNKSKTLHFCIFGYRPYVFFSDKVCVNKLVL